MLFREVIGHETVKKKLTTSAREGRISHAQLFLGPEGSGALPMALAYAQYISCENRTDDDSCGTCPSCIKYSKLIHPDLHFSYPFVGSKELSTNFLVQWRAAVQANSYMNAQQWLQTIAEENKQGNITADECRDIIKRLSLKAFEGGYKVMIVWMPEYLDKEGNILLKLIEEPPAKTLLLLVAENPDQLLVTITSRTQLTKIGRLSDNDLSKALIEQKGVPVQDAANVARIADGSYNAALQLLQSEQGVNYDSFFIDWLRKCYVLNSLKQEVIGDLINWVDETAKWGRERQKSFLLAGLHLVRECMMINFAGNELVKLSGANLESYKKLAVLINLVNGEQLIETINDSIHQIERNANAKILFMSLSIKTNYLLKLK